MHPHVCSIPSMHVVNGLGVIYIVRMYGTRAMTALQVAAVRSGPLAQSAERGADNAKVVSSSLTWTISFAFFFSSELKRLGMLFSRPCLSSHLSCFVLNFYLFLSLCLLSTKVVTTSLVPSLSAERLGTRLGHNFHCLLFVVVVVCVLLYCLLLLFACTNSVIYHLQSLCTRCKRMVSMPTSVWGHMSSRRLKKHSLDTRSES